MDLNIEFNAAPIRRSMVSKKVLTCAGVLLVTAGCAWNQMAKSEFSLVGDATPAKSVAKPAVEVVGDDATVTAIAAAADKIHKDTTNCPSSGQGEACFTFLLNELKTVPEDDTLTSFEEDQQLTDWNAAIKKITDKVGAFSNVGSDSADVTAKGLYDAKIAKFKKVKKKAAKAAKSTDVYADLVTVCEASGAIGLAIEACKNDTKLDQCAPAVVIAIKDTTVQKVKAMKDGIDTTKKEAVKCFENFKENAYNKVKDDDTVKQHKDDADAIFRNIGGVNWALIIGCAVGAIGLVVVGFFVYKKFGAKEGAATAGEQDAA